MKTIISFLKRPLPYALLFIIIQVLFAGSIIYGRVQKSSQCRVYPGQHVIRITSKGFKPADASIPVCSEVVFINDDTKPHQPAFGAFGSHDNPAGFTEKVLADRGDSNRFVITEAGVYSFHDHSEHEKGGSFTVVP